MLVKEGIFQFTLIAEDHKIEVNESEFSGTMDTFVEGNKVGAFPVYLREEKMKKIDYDSKYEIVVHNNEDENYTSIPVLFKNLLLEK